MMLLIEQPPAAAVWALLVTTVGSIITQIVLQILRANDDFRKEEQRHRFAQEDMKETRRFRDATSATLAQNTNTLSAAATQINDGIHRVETKAEVAYDTANHINAKLATIAKTALKARQATEDNNVNLIRQDIFNLLHHIKNRPDPPPPLIDESYRAGMPPDPGEKS